MTNLLIYTFRTFPYKGDTPFEKFNVFNKLNNDIKLFCREIITVRPNYILGLAKSTERHSMIEKYAVNKFQANKKILNNAPDSYELDIPTKLRKYFPVRTEPTKSFCNLSIFKIKYFLEKNHLNTPFAFLHILKDDLKKLNEL